MRPRLLAAKLVFLIHLLFIAFVVLAPFTASPLLHALHVSVVACLILHWSVNSNVCCLTLLEHYLTGAPMGSGFVAQVVDGIYAVQPAEITASTLFLGCLSVYRIIQERHIFGDAMGRWDETALSALVGALSAS